MRSVVPPPGRLTPADHLPLPASDGSDGSLQYRSGPLACHLSKTPSNSAESFGYEPKVTFSLGFAVSLRRQEALPPETLRVVPLSPGPRIAERSARPGTGCQGEGPQVPGAMLRLDDGPVELLGNWGRIPAGAATFRGVRIEE